MHTQAAFLDSEVWPHARHQLVLGDNFARAFGQDDQNVQCAATQLERDPSPLQTSFRREETKLTKCDCVRDR